MNVLHLLAWFLGGAFAANCVPHLVAGVQGRAFQTPFAKPPGVGLSTSRTNVLWAALNVIAAYVLVMKVGQFDLRNAIDATVLFLGALLSALLIAGHFGKLHGGTTIEPK